jgi:hypothetical protein
MVSAGSLGPPAALRNDAFLAGELPDLVAHATLATGLALPGDEEAGFLCRSPLPSATGIIG